MKNKKINKVPKEKVMLFGAIFLILLFGTPRILDYLNAPPKTFLLVGLFTGITIVVLFLIIFKKDLH